MDIETRAASSNDILSYAEQVAVRSSINETEGRIKTLDQAIAQLQIVISNLDGQRREETSRIMRLRVGIAPHKRVPPEILSKIFVYAKDRKVLRFPLSPGDPIWGVMQVCSRWRKIIIAEPSIWKDIRCMGGGDPEALNYMMHDLFRNRGGGTLIKYWAPPIVNKQDWDQLLGLLYTYPSRFNNLELLFNSFPPVSVLGAPAKLDHLESLHIRFNGIPRKYRDVRQTPKFFTSKSLREVSLSSKGPTTIPLLHNPFHIPWGQIYKITMEDIPVLVLKSILRECTTVVECNLTLRSNRLAEAIVEEYPIHLEYLEILTFFDYSDFSDSKFILDLLTVPALKKLSFTNLHWEQWPRDCILQLISRSSCLLEVFNAPHYKFREEDLLPLLQVTPSLKELVLYPKVLITDATINSIRKNSLAPELQVLEGFGLSSLRPLIELLESRLDKRGEREIQGIRKAYIEIPAERLVDDDEYSKKALKRLEEYGVELYITRR